MFIFAVKNSNCKILGRIPKTNYVFESNAGKFGNQMIRVQYI